VKKILKSLLILSLVASSVYGIAQSGAWFSDQEVLGDNTVNAGTINIDAGLVGGGPFTIGDMKPSTVHYMQMLVDNVGDNQADIWKRIMVTGYDDNGHPESEDGNVTDNKIGAVIRYDMQVNGDVLISEADNYVLDTSWRQLANTTAIDGYWMYLGRVLAGETMEVDQSYHMDGSTGNWAQSDQMTFDVEIFAQQIVGGATSQAGELIGLERCQGTDPGQLEMYNIGTGEDGDHSLAGWSDVWTWGGGYGGGDDGSFRLLMGPGDGCSDGDVAAEFTMHAEDKYGVQLVLKHLDGSQDDSFDLYVKIASVWTKFGHYEAQGGGENWQTTTFNLPQPVTGDVEFKLVATQPANDWCASWGQVAFSWAELVHSTCPVTP